MHLFLLSALNKDGAICMYKNSLLFTRMNWRKSSTTPAIGGLMEKSPTRQWKPKRVRPFDKRKNNAT